MIKVQLEVDVTSHSVQLELNSTAEVLWRKANASGSDVDWMEFSDYVGDDVAEKLEFCLTDGKEVTP